MVHKPIPLSEFTVLITTKFSRLVKDSGLTASQLAKKTGINPRQIRKMMSGEIDMKNVSLGNAVKLSKAMGVSPEDLLN